MDLNERELSARSGGIPVGGNNRQFESRGRQVRAGRIAGGSSQAPPEFRGGGSSQGAAMRTPARILLVEDSPADVRLAQEVLNEARLDHQLFVAENGEEAMQMLRDPVASIGGQLPDLILLDLNLPRMSGHEVLNEVKQDPRWRRIPVLILSTSSSEDDVRACYDAHANAYLTKPVDWAQFVSLAGALRDFWFRFVRLPATPTSPN
jgi:CheY-like chemotaxis protein